jgi:archaellin
MMMKYAQAMVTCVAVLWAAGAMAADRAIEDFYGEYAGRSISASADKLKTRDINVEIKEIRRGFNVAWTTVTLREGKKATRKSYSIDFKKTKRGGIFQSAMRKDVFGNRAPNDPMRGDPYVWARLRGDTLSVYALIVTGDGSYDMQVYNRTLTANGMVLEFKRFLEGQEVKSIKGELARIK